MKIFLEFEQVQILYLNFFNIYLFFILNYHYDVTLRLPNNSEINYSQLLLNLTKRFNILLFNPFYL